VKRDEGRGTKEAQRRKRISGYQESRRVGSGAPGDQDAAVDSVGYSHRFVWTWIDFDRVFDGEWA
jgi:hypothetical protein